MSDPYRCDGGNPYGLLDEDRNGRDDRLLGFLPATPGSRAALVVDSETGLVYVGGEGNGSGLKIIGAQEPRMEFLLDDPAHPGQYQVPGYPSRDPCSRLGENHTCPKSSGHPPAREGGTV
ncbi:MAG: hypothetical protein ACP5VN_09145, partial [Acidobacteriota bacterium]